MSFAVGSLVKARGREWVVLPESDDDLLVVRPLGGSDDEVTGICRALEEISPASFSLPTADDLGDYRSCRLLRDSVRLGFRASAGPFRSFAQIAVEPRPYQLVPLLMALKLDPVRLLISDDVGIGKTVEACLIAREMLDRGEIRRIGVLCPPHLAEQWQTELADKFHIQAELVLASTARRLESACAINQSIFDIYPHVIVSTDYIKSDRRRDDFIRTCPDLLIVDEAHTCAFGDQSRGGRHQRYQLLKGISQRPDRHIILVTATPHSGKEDAFRSLLQFLNDDFANLPDDLSGPAAEAHRRAIAHQFVQRRRGDIIAYMEETTFPKRLEREETYTLSLEYRRLFDRVLTYAREIVHDTASSTFQQRVRWWSALALLRSLASSPAAAVATLRNRAATVGPDEARDVEEMGLRTVMDMESDEEAETLDVAPGGDAAEFTADEQRTRSRLLDMAREAEKLRGEKDLKLTGVVRIVKEMVKDGYNPIVFCRYIPTADYVAEALRKGLSGVEVAAVTGQVPPVEREQRVNQLGEQPKRVLVCTDCLSEGINLQDKFDAVIHYDLSWNPTRHEQREGRVDRFGQPRSDIRVVSYYGTDNQIDGIVLDVLIRKHKTIRTSLGISVPVPVDTNKVVEAIFEGLLLKENQGKSNHEQLALFDDFFKPKKEDLFKQWDMVSEREVKRSRTMYAQWAIKVDEVAAELQAVRQAIGSGVGVASFVEQALRSHGAIIDTSADGSLKVDLAESPRALRDLLPCPDRFAARFSLPVKDGELYLTRTHPLVEGLATYIMDTALDPIMSSVARRCGVVSTRFMERRTTLLLVRFRYHIVTKHGSEEQTLLAEDCQVIGFAGAPASAEWLPTDQAEALLTARPDGNVPPDIGRHQLQRILESFGSIEDKLTAIARKRGDELLNAHRRVRQSAQMRVAGTRVEPQLPPDVLGVYIYVPHQGGA